MKAHGTLQKVHKFDCSDGRFETASSVWMTQIFSLSAKCLFSKIQSTQNTRSDQVKHENMHDFKREWFISVNILKYSTGTPSVVFVFSRLDVLFDCSAAKQFQQVLIVSENDNIALWQLFDILWQILWQTLWQKLWIGEAQKLYLDCVLLQICFSNYYCMYYI